VSEIINIAPERAILGESPVWSAAEGALYWVDISACRMHRAEIASRRVQSWDTPGFVGMIALRGRGGLIAALVDGVYAFDPGAESWQRLLALESDRPENRPNDGKCDAAGRLWLGTMNTEDPARPTGAFYRIDPDLTVSKIAGGLRVPNGLAWSPDDRTMYHTDTRAGMVRRHAFDPGTGRRGEGAPYFAFDRATTGVVDGAAMDSSGGYWAALYGGARVVRINSAGEIDREIPLPVSQPTMPAFGGPEMKTLFVTTASQKLDETALAAEPEAGGLLMLETEVSGHPVYPFGG
jgi:sugar lactone lactonase YvrE|tara:strand:+ start:427 stop:1305 length:879 start_codon:yes stop_codon:yes gene_type:complete